MIYSLLVSVLWIISLPFILLLSFKSKYRKSLPARFFLYKNPPFKECDIHFHLCSLGEVRACSNLIKNFKNTAITVCTATGYEFAKKIEDNSRFLPCEALLPFWLKKSKVLVIFEAELWLNLVRAAKKNGSYIVLLNARMSDKSYKNYLKFKFYYEKVFKNIDLVLAQNEVDKIRLETLGANNIKVFGNIKSSNSAQISNKLKKTKKLLVIASTHKDEEEMILKAIEPNLNTNLKDYQILLAPRHPERFSYAGEIFFKFAKKHDKSFEKFSDNSDLKSDFILLDTLGELSEFYAICDTVILGGSFIENIGGHNPIEVAEFNKPLISGRFIHNQKELFDLVENVNFADIDELSNLISKDLEPTSIKRKFDIQALINILKEKI